MNLALFDFDGTITTVGTYPIFLRFATGPVRTVIGGALVSPFIVGYTLGVVSDRRIRPPLSRAAFVGRLREEVAEEGRVFSRTILPGLMRPEALDRIGWHRAHGDDVVVVSASLDVYLVPWCASVGVDVICTTLETRNGRLTGRYLHGDCCDAEKPRRIRERYDLSRYRTIYAYGDSAEDEAMLDLADETWYRWERVPRRATKGARRER